jgi:hypothetical protein
MASDAERKKGVRRTAIILALVAIAVYLGFIYLSAMRS